MSGRLEAGNMRAMWGAVGVAGMTAFRLNSGRAWTAAGKPGHLPDGRVVLPAGSRPIALGMSLASGDPVVGQSDLFGWTSVVITPEMVGCRVAVATGIEAKRETGGRTSEDQHNFGSQLLRAGGIWGVANTPAVAQAIIRDWKPPRV